MIEVKLPDGSVAKFPDGTSPEVIKNALQKQVQATQAEPDLFKRDENGVPEGYVMDPNTGGMTSREMMAQDMKTGQGMSAVTGGVQGMSYGFGDELAGAVGAVEGLLRGEEGMGEFRREQARAKMDASRRDNPITTTAAEIGGVIASPVNRLFPAPRGASMLERLPGAAKAGGGMGALYSAGQGEGLEGRANDAVKGAAIGAAAGMAAEPIMSGAAAAGRVLWDPIKGAFGRGNDKRAARYITQVMKRAGKTPAEIDDALRQAAAEGQDVYTLADATGNAGQRALSGVTRTANDARQGVVEALQKRQSGQANRISASVADALDAPRTAKAQKTTMTAARTKAADLQYPAASAGAKPVVLDDVLSVIDDRLGPMKGRKWAENSIDSIYDDFRGRLSQSVDDTTEYLTDYDRVLGVKQEMYDKIQNLRRAGSDNAARELGKIYSKLDEALESASPKYRAANDNFRKASKEIEAVDIGADAARPSRRAADTIDEFRKMTPEEQAAARVGYADKTITPIERGAVGSNKARPLTSEKFEREVAAMAPTREAAEKLARQLAREQTMFETGATAMGGSRTADNIADTGDVVAALPAGVLRDLFTGRWVNAGRGALSEGGQALTGRNSGTVEKIAEALMSRGPKANAVIKNASRQELIDAMKVMNSAQMLRRAIAPRSADLAKQILPQEP